MAEEQKIEETLSRRGGTYGDFRDNARISQNIKKAMQDSPNWQVLPPYLKEGLELIALKMSRILSGDPLYADNPHDMIGYAKLIEDRAAQDREAGVVIPSPGDPLYPEYDHTYRGDMITETVRVGDISKTTTRPVERPKWLRDAFGYWKPVQNGDRWMIVKDRMGEESLYFVDEMDRQAEHKMDEDEAMQQARFLNSIPFTGYLADREYWFAVPESKLASFNGLREETKTHLG